MKWLFDILTQLWKSGLSASVKVFITGGIIILLSVGYFYHKYEINAQSRQDKQTIALMDELKNIKDVQIKSTQTAIEERESLRKAVDTMTYNQRIILYQVERNADKINIWGKKQDQVTKENLKLIDEMYEKRLKDLDDIMHYEYLDPKPSNLENGHLHELTNGIFFTDTIPEKKKFKPIGFLIRLISGNGV